MQIRKLALYSKRGEIRTIDFKLGAVNIITGKSRTGKSAIIDIIDYCLGRTTFNIFEGVNREIVVWYAVILQVDEGQVLLAKPAPTGAAKFQSSVYLETGTEIDFPPLENLKPNTNDKAILAHLSRLLGISSNQTEPQVGRTTVPFEATIDHAKYYLFQEQGLIANRKLLFYRQDEEFIPQHIKDTMPYFLGAVQEDRLQLVQQLKDAKRQLTLARRRLTEAEAVVSERLAQAQSLLSESKEVGITAATLEADNTSELLSLLNKAAQWSPQEAIMQSDDLLTEAREALQGSQNEFGRKLREIQEAEKFLRNTQGYHTEAEQQFLRLQSIGIVTPNGTDTSVCPICASELDDPPPSARAITRSLAQIERNLQSVRREEPRLQEHLINLRRELETIRIRVQDSRETVNALVREREAAAQLQDSHTRAARVSGRISLYLENIEATDDNAPLRQAVEEAARRVEELDEQLDAEEVEDLKGSILNVISAQMTEWARVLKLEHADNPYRLDDKRLTVVVDTPERPISMDRMGSGENWLGCHLISLLALHQHFIRRQRPVPNFIILDQPSQVYFPSYDSYKALEGDINNLEEVGADVIAVRRMFDFLFDTVAKLTPNLQIIVMEHANFSDERFQEALVEEPWRGNRALIPQDWLE